MRPLPWAYEDADQTRHSDEYCRRQREAALEDFDLNMVFLAQIPPDSFDDAPTELLRKTRRYAPIFDLRSLDEDEGVYLMVLDEYRQAYIGQSSDFRARIKKIGPVPSSSTGCYGPASMSQVLRRRCSHGDACAFHLGLRSNLVNSSQRLARPRPMSRLVR
jgi:hypothetical protein